MYALANYKHTGDTKVVYTSTSYELLKLVDERKTVLDANRLLPRPTFNEPDQEAPRFLSHGDVGVGNSGYH